MRRDHFGDIWFPHIHPLHVWYFMYNVISTLTPCEVTVLEVRTSFWGGKQLELVWEDLKAKGVSYV